MHSLGLVKTRTDQGLDPGTKIRCFVFPDIFPTSPRITKFSTFSRFPDLVGTLPIRLHSSKDLDEMTELAQARKFWRGLISQIEKAAD